MKGVLVNFFLNLRGKFIEEVAHEIQAILLQHIPLNESGSISLAGQQVILRQPYYQLPRRKQFDFVMSEYQSFLLSEDLHLTPDALAAQQLVSSKLQLSALLSNRLSSNLSLYSSTIPLPLLTCASTDPNYSENGLAQQVADIIASADKGTYLISWNKPFILEAMNGRVSHALYQDGDGFLLSSEVLDTLQQLLTERFRLEVEEDASGMNVLLFEFVDTDKSETIELTGESPFNIFIW